MSMPEEVEHNPQNVDAEDRKDNENWKLAMHPERSAKPEN